MHAGRKFTLKEVINWTRRDIYKYTLLAAITTLLYHFVPKEFSFLGIPWEPVALLGTATSFIVGFKNNASYGRLWEARTIYGGIINTSRAFAAMVKNYISKEHASEVKEIFNRHYAWLTALRYQLRDARTWENMNEPENIEYRSYYKVPERDIPVETELRKYLSPNELTYILTKKNKATQLLAKQSEHLKSLFDKDIIDQFEYQQLQQSITALYDSQGKAERIKNFPYPRNFSSIATILLSLFITLVPVGLLNKFDALGKGSIIEGYTVWLNIPFAVIVMWVFNTLDKVGESSMNPFEGSANDVPISNISRTIEIDMRDMLDEHNIPSPTTAENNILV